MFRPAGNASGDSWSADASSLYAYAAAGSGSTQLAAYASLLQTAKQFIKQRRREVQQRQEAVMAAQADWKTVLAAMEEQQQLHLASGAAVPAELVQALQQLKQLKGVLQDQIHTLNDETQQVKGLKARVSCGPVLWRHYNIDNHHAISMPVGTRSQQPRLHHRGCSSMYALDACRDSD